MWILCKIIKCQGVPTPITVFLSKSLKSIFYPNLINALQVCIGSLSDEKHFTDDTMIRRIRNKKAPSVTPHHHRDRAEESLWYLTSFICPETDSVDRSRNPKMSTKK